MTHYTVDYSCFESRPERKRKAALVDVREYMGRKRFEVLRTMMRKTVVVSTDKFEAMDYWEYALSFAGIQGYPVKALVLSYVPNGKEICK